MSIADLKPKGSRPPLAGQVSEQSHCPALLVLEPTSGGFYQIPSIRGQLSLGSSGSGLCSELKWVHLENSGWGIFEVWQRNGQIGNML